MSLSLICKTACRNLPVGEPRAASGGRGTGNRFVGRTEPRRGTGRRCAFRGFPGFPGASRSFPERGRVCGRSGWSGATDSGRLVGGVRSGSRAGRYGGRRVTGPKKAVPPELRRDGCAVCRVRIRTPGCGSAVHDSCRTGRIRCDKPRLRSAGAGACRIWCGWFSEGGLRQAADRTLPADGADPSDWRLFRVDELVELVAAADDARRADGAELALPHLARRRAVGSVQLLEPLFGHARRGAEEEDLVAHGHG